MLLHWKKLITVPPKKIKEEPWITFRILKGSKQLCKLYKNILSDNANEAQINKYKEQCSILCKLKSQGKQVYYTNKYQEYSKQSKQAWQLINLLTNHCKNKSHVIEQTDVDNITYLISKWHCQQIWWLFFLNRKYNGLWNKQSRTPVNDYISKIQNSSTSIFCIHVHDMKYQNI